MQQKIKPYRCPRRLHIIAPPQNAVHTSNIMMHSDQAWINFNAPLLWRDEMSGDLDPRLLEDDLTVLDEDMADKIPQSQLDYTSNWVCNPPGIAPSCDLAIVPSAHPSLYNPPPKSRQMGGVQGMPPGLFETRLPPNAHQISPQSTLPQVLPVPSRIPPHFSSPSFAPHNFPQPCQSRQETNQTPAYKCEWISTDGQICDMHFASDQNSVFRHLEGRHQVSRVGTSLCRWGSCRVSPNRGCIPRCWSRPRGYASCGAVSRRQSTPVKLVGTMCRGRGTSHRHPKQHPHRYIRRHSSYTP
ncbi:hypothetical protein BJ138DRAFT_1163712 [Hygrophoropsis aurantiaca]|uniref:Uncharacterized protein n=1 Tax=Hygrophoropsis aurantiaca TaxID=72124 RepID=A0ACB7ZYY1_9AGAM|nr:hypothetical protein BJ138DRAFT_1163712 [Hygrophoropsis aurantiaca]